MCCHWLIQLVSLYLISQRWNWECIFLLAAIVCVVPHGSMLGPLLVFSYMIDVPNYCLHMIFFSGDDPILLYDSKSFVCFQNEVITEISSCYAENKLLSISSKIRWITFKSSKSNVFSEAKVLLESENVKCLGMNNDKALKFDCHIRENVRINVATNISAFHNASINNTCFFHVL